jgi:REP element-mobilizing transposase RayT
MKRLHPYIGRYIKITYCWCCAPSYFNLQPNTIHKIVRAPEGFKNSKNCVWVRGIGAFCSLQKEEFNFIIYRQK